MGSTRRTALGSLVSLSLTAAHQPPPDDQERKYPFPHENDDKKLPNGKSQKDEIARQDFAQSLRDADIMVEAAQSLRDNLKKSGSYAVSLDAVRKTEEIEKLARKIRSRLKA